MDEQIPQPEPRPDASGQEQMPVQEMSQPPRHFLNKKFIITFVVLLLLGSGAYAGIWYWSNQQVAQEVVPTFTPRADATADWKTYTNTQYGFEFKYPTDLSVCDIIPPKSLGTAGYITRITYSECGKVADPNLSPNKVGSGGILVWTNITQDFKAFVYSQYDAANSQYITNTKINGVDTYVHKSASGLSEDYFFKVSNEVLEISAASSASNVWVQNIDQILSTFKFTNSADTSTWKTYTNIKYGYEFKYPQGALLNASDEGMGGDVPINNTGSEIRLRPASGKDAVFIVTNSISPQKLTPDWISHQYLDSTKIHPTAITMFGLSGFKVPQDNYTVSDWYYLQKADGSFVSIVANGSLANQILSTFKFIK